MTSATPRRWARRKSKLFSALATDLNISASTQNLALSSIFFLYKEVLEIDLPWLDNIVHAKKPQRLPTMESVINVSFMASSFPTLTVA